MTQDRNPKKESGDLRKRAEELLLCKASNVGNISELPQEDVQKLVHELRVHQIELEMQNDELRRVQLETEGIQGEIYRFV